jgi:hypothetical protein
MIQEAIGNFGGITYVELFDEDVLDYGQRVWLCPQSNTYQHFANQGWRTKKFKSLEDAKLYCDHEGISIIRERAISHPLANGLPDCRSISAYL